VDIILSLEFIAGAAIRAADFFPQKNNFVVNYILKLYQKKLTKFYH